MYGVPAMGYELLAIVIYCHVLKKVDTITTITFFFFLLLFFLFTIHIMDVDYYKPI